MTSLAAPKLTDPVPEAHPAVASVTVDGETVLYDERTGGTHVLNSTASVLWSCLGSGGSNAELVDDLADAFELPPAALADDVVATLGQLAKAGLLADGRPTAPPAPSAHDGPHYLEEADTGCMRAVERLGWEAQVGVQLPTGLRVGVRTNTAEAAAVLRDVLGSVVVDDALCAPNLSVRLEPASSGAVRRLHTVYRSCSLALRTRQRERALRAVIAQLWAFTAADRDDAAHVYTTALARGDQLVLAPPRLRRRMIDLEPRLRRSGIGVVESPVVALDPGGEPVAIVEAAPLAVPSPATVDDTVELSPPTGRYKVVGRLVVGTDPAPDRAALLAGALTDIGNVARLGGGRALEAASTLARVPTRVSASWDAAAIAADVAGLFDPA